MVSAAALTVLLCLGADAKASSAPDAGKSGAAKGSKAEAPATQCPAWIYFEPHFFSRHIADASLTTPVEVLSQSGAWAKIRAGSDEGFVPSSALTPPPGDAPARQAVTAYLAKEGLAPLEAWIIRYEGSTTGARMRARLEDLRTFIRDGALEPPK